jgi:hypothetical protein
MVFPVQIECINEANIPANHSQRIPGCCRVGRLTCSVIGWHAAKWGDWGSFGLFPPFLTFCVNFDWLFK